MFCVQRTASGHVVNTVLGLPKLKTGRSTGGGAKAGGGKSKGGSGAAGISRRDEGRVETWTRRGSRSFLSGRRTSSEGLVYLIKCLRPTCQ